MLPQRPQRLLPCTFHTPGDSPRVSRWVHFSGLPCPRAHVFKALALAVVIALPAEALAAPAEGPTLAKEDTMRTDVSTVLVKAPRVTLEEILDRVARGEARRDSLMRDQSFTATLRVMRDTESKKAPVLFAESVSKVYKKKRTSCARSSCATTKRSPTRAITATMKTSTPTSRRAWARRS
jgi:hypothetical protein